MVVPAHFTPFPTPDEYHYGRPMQSMIPGNGPDPTAATSRRAANASQAPSDDMASQEWLTSLGLGGFIAPQPSNAGPSDHSRLQQRSTGSNGGVPAAGLESTSGSRSYPTIPSSGNPTKPPDVVQPFLADMPSIQDDSVRHQHWTDLIRLKTRSLELQIAEARQKEREAELELMRIKEEYRIRTSLRASAASEVTGAQATVDPFDQFAFKPDAMGSTFTTQSAQNPVDSGPASFDFSAFQESAQPASADAELTGLHASYANPTGPARVQTPVTPFDLEAMLQSSNLDNMFSWLPDFSDHPKPGLTPNLLGTFAKPMQTHVDPNDLLVQADQSAQPPSTTSEHVPYQPFFSGQLGQPEPTAVSPTRRRSRSLDDDEQPAKKAKRPEKKIVVDQNSDCVKCSKSLARVMIRAPRSQIPDIINVQITCEACQAVQQLPVLPDAQNTSGSTIGTVDSRKRLRIAMEVEDEERKDDNKRRAFCDVCQRIVGSGIVAGRALKGEKENLGYMSEVICASCDLKYQRCTDCGGGGGSRLGIGKWRMKQVFQPGRKTCSLSHNRLGDRPREIGVHVTPTDFTPEELKEVISRCRALWNEKTLARLAVPEMFEIDLPSHLINPLQKYADVEDIVTRNWPGREAMIHASGEDPNRFKRLLGLIWSHAKPRRSARTVDLEEDWQRPGDAEDDDDMSTVLDNVKRTNVVIPAGSELIGMWGGEWDMQHGSILVSTFIPFEGADGEDSTAVSVGEMITKVQTLRHAINAERKAAAIKEGRNPEDDKVPQCEHLWVVSGGTMPLVRERLADILVRKRSFVHVEEYLTRHPDFIHALKARPNGLHPDLHHLSYQDETPPPLVLVRWLGKDFDAQKILEIKQAEFGGKGKMKKRVKSRA